MMTKSDMTSRFPGRYLREAMQVQHRDERDLLQVGCDRNATCRQSEAHGPVLITLRFEGAMTDFDTFWAAYPRKIGRFKARTAYDRALKVAAPEAILEGLERVKRGWATKEAQYIPHATTWLARGGWEDEDGLSRTNVHPLKEAAIAGYYAPYGSSELAAWDQWWRETRGVNAPRDKRFGYRFPTRWPPP